MFSPSLEYLAARDHMMHVVYGFLQPTRLLDMYVIALFLGGSVFQAIIFGVAP